MSKLPGPVDELAPIPLPIAPQPDQWPPSPGHLSVHHSMFPYNAPELVCPPVKESQRTVFQTGSIAVRNSGLQYTTATTHNKGLFAFHRFWTRPPLPANEAEQFELLTWRMAGFLPVYGADASTGVPRIVRLTSAQRAILQEPTPSQRIGYRNLRTSPSRVIPFATRYVIRQSLDHIKRQDWIEEYIDPQTPYKNTERWKWLGHRLLTEQIKVAVDGMRLRYETAAQLELLDPRLNTLGRTMSPIGLVKRYMLGCVEVQEGVLFPKLASILRAQQQDAA